MRVSFQNLSSQFKRAPRVSKILSLAVSLLGLVMLLVLAQTGIQFLSSFAQVAPSVRFDSSSYTLTSPSSTSVRVLVEPGSYQIGFVRVEVVFDTSKVRLSNEVSLSSSLFTRSLFVSTRDQANSQGKVIIALGLDPSQRTNPPTQTFELAQLFFTPATTTSNQTSTLTFNSAGMQIVNFSYTKLSFTTQGASLTINPTTITSTSTPTPRPTNTPTPTPTRAPTPTPSGPTPTIPPPPGGSTYGTYPNCIPPGVPFESQSWWKEKQNPSPGDDHPRHVHHAACAPQARDSTGEAFSVSGKFDLMYVTTLFNSPAELQWVISGLVGPTGNCPGGGEFCKIFNPPLVCNQPSSHGLPHRGLCTIYTYLNPAIDTTLTSDGLKESRPKPNVSHRDLGPAREFTTLNFQYYIKNGGSASNYRSGPVMIGRGWYDKGVDYANATFVNYMNYFHGRTDISVPIVSGTISLQVGHAKGEGTVRKRLLLDPAFHANPPSMGTVLYDEPGNGDRTYSWDTTRVPNGRHTLMAQTEEEVDIGIHTGIAKVFFDVRN